MSILPSSGFRFIFLVEREHPPPPPAHSVLPADVLLLPCSRRDSMTKRRLVGGGSASGRPVLWRVGVRPRAYPPPSPPPSPSPTLRLLALFFESSVSIRHLRPLALPAEIVLLQRFRCHVITKRRSVGGGGAPGPSIFWRVGVRSRASSSPSPPLSPSPSSR